jgi:hypothetical protein
MLLLRSALAVAILVAAGCSVEPTQINPPPSAQHQQSSSITIDWMSLTRSTTRLLKKWSLMLIPPRPLIDDGSQFVDAAPQTPQADLLALANQTKAAGDDASYVSYLKSAAEQGSADAHYDLAKVYTDGKIVPRDLNDASGHLRSSAGLGNPEALRVMAWQLVKGLDGSPDLGSGGAMMEEAAKSSVRAQREAGMLFANLYRYHLNDVEKGKALLTCSGSRLKTRWLAISALFGSNYLRLTEPSGSH